MNYLRYWSFLRRPFLYAAGEHFYAGPPQREALAGLSYFIGCQEPIATLVSPPNNGLSWLLNHAAEMRGFGDRAAELVVTDGRHHDRNQIIGQLARSIGFQSTIDNVQQQIHAAIETLRARDLCLVWQLDNAQPEAARIAAELAAEHANLSILIGCRPETVPSILLAVGGQAIQINLSPLSIEDACHYVTQSLSRVGGKRTIIPDNSIVRLHEVTGGMIGPLAWIAEHSLALAASHTLEYVSTAIVEAIAQQRRTVNPTSADYKTDERQAA